MFGGTAQLGIALGTWKENFWKKMDIATPTCSRSLTDFSEKGGVKRSCFPVVGCPAQPPISRSKCVDRGVGAVGDSCPAGRVAPGQMKYKVKMGCGGEQCPLAAAAWDRVNMAMHHDMAIKFSGDVALDFVRGMIPHHNGAVDMCDLLLHNLTCAEVCPLSRLAGWRSECVQHAAGLCVSSC